jgi:hypothetical protein
MIDRVTDHLVAVLQNFDKILRFRPTCFLRRISTSTPWQHLQPTQKKLVTMAAESDGATAALDLTLSALELKKHYCPRGNKTGALNPPPTWRTSIEKVKDWYALSKAQQQHEQVQWKALSRGQQDGLKRAVPGFVERPPRTRPVASRTRHSSQRRASSSSRASTRPSIAAPRSLPAGMASSEEERIIASADMTRGGSTQKPKRTSKTNAPTVSAQNDKIVKRARTNALASTAKLVHNTHPSFLVAPNMPRQHALTIVVNEVEDKAANGGKPKKGSKRREKPQLFVVGSGHDMKHNPALKAAAKAIRDPESFEIIPFFQGSATTIDGNEENVPPPALPLPDQVRARLKQDTVGRSRPSSRVATHEETSRNVLADAITGVASPTQTAQV